MIVLLHYDVWEFCYSNILGSKIYTLTDSKMTKEWDLILFWSHYNVSLFWYSNRRLHLSRFQGDKRVGFYFVHRRRCLDIWGSWQTARGQEFKRTIECLLSNTETQIEIHTRKYKCISIHWRFGDRCLLSTLLSNQSKKGQDFLTDGPVLTEKEPKAAPNYKGWVKKGGPFREAHMSAYSSLI